MRHILIYEKFLDGIYDPAEAKKVYRKLAKELHSDKGGNVEDMKILNNEYEKFKKGNLSNKPPTSGSNSNTTSNASNNSNTTNASGRVSSNSFSENILSSLHNISKELLKGRNVRISQVYEDGRMATLTYCINIEFLDSTLGISGSSSREKIFMTIYYRNGYGKNVDGKYEYSWGLNYLANQLVSRHIAVNNIEETKKWLASVFSKFKPE